MAQRILIVEDDTNVAEGLQYSLEQEGFEVATAADGRAALEQFQQHPPDLVVLDLMLPHINGWELFAIFRRQVSKMPVIMLTARVEEADRVAGLEMGADDYVTKPFSTREVAARVRAVLRRVSPQDDDSEAVIARAGVYLDADKHEVTVDGQHVELSPKEFDLLSYLMHHAGRVRTRSAILETVWGQDAYLDERTVDVHVRWLRKKIEIEPNEPQRILTVRGVGYKFTEASS
jgi:DNA-binding response OmpR family regulator